METIDSPIYLLVWRYGDNSAFGVLRAYVDEDRARNDMKLLARANSDKHFLLLEPEEFEDLPYCEYGDIVWSKKP